MICNDASGSTAPEVPGFTKRYGVNRLVYVQRFGDVRDAITFEKRLKRWRRDPPATPCSWVPDNRCAVSGMTDRDLRERWSLKF